MCLWFRSLPASLFLFFLPYSQSLLFIRRRRRRRCRPLFFSLDLFFFFLAVWFVAWPNLSASLVERTGRQDGRCEPLRKKNRRRRRDAAWVVLWVGRRSVLLHPVDSLALFWWRRRDGEAKSLKEKKGSNSTMLIANGRGGWASSFRLFHSFSFFFCIWFDFYLLFDVL